jgi:hypothetical protein
MRILIAYSYTPFQPRDPVALSLIRACRSRYGEDLIEVIKLPIVAGVPGWSAQVAAIRTHQVIDVYQGKLNRLIALDYPAFALPHPNKVLWLRSFSSDDVEVQQRYLREATRVFAGSRVVEERLQRVGIKCELLSVPVDQDWERVIRRLTR